MKKFLSILFLLLLVIALPIVNISSKALTNKTINDAVYFDITPTLVTSSEDCIYVFNASDNFVYSLKEKTIVKTSLTGNFSTLKHFNSNLYYSSGKSLYKYNILSQTSSMIISLESDIVDFIIESNDIYILTNTTLYNYSPSSSTTSSISSVFTSAKALAIKENVIYVIDVNKLYSVNQGVVVLLGIISQQTSSTYQLIALNDNLLVLEKPKNTINLFSFKGTLLANSLDTTNNVVTRTFKSGEVFSIDGFCKQGDNIIICDSIAKSIQAFSLTNGRLIFSSLLAATKGADTNRLNHAQDFDILNTDIFVFADTDNNRVTLVNHKEGTAFELDHLFSVPRIVTVNNVEEIYVYDNNYLTKIGSDKSKQEISLPFSVYDIVCDTLSNTYLYDATNQKIVKMVNSTFEDISSIPVSSNLQMCINASATQLYVLHDNLISIIDLENKSNISNITLSSSPVSIAVDYKNNVYVLNKTTNGYSLSKLTDGNIVTSKEIQTADKLIKMNIDLHTGKVYALNDTLCCLTDLEVNFAENLLSFTSQTANFNTDPLKKEVEVYTVKTSCQAYKYPFNVSPLLALEQGDKVIVLNDNVQENNKFAYCLITGKSVNNIAAYIQKSTLEKVSSQLIPEYSKVKVITAIANVYKYPTASLISVNSESITCNLTALQLRRDDTVKILSYAYDLTDINGTKFMCVQLDNGDIVYINQNTAINSDLDADKYNKVFQPNGKLVSQRQVPIEGFTLNEDGSYTKVTTFEHGRLIYLENAFDTNKEYTKIVYLNSNNEQISLYVLTRFVDPDDITVPQIIGLIILLFVIISSTLLIIILVKNKKIKSFE